MIKKSIKKSLEQSTVLVKCTEILSRILLIFSLILLVYATTICNNRYKFYVLRQNFTWLIWFFPFILSITIESISLALQKQRKLKIGRNIRNFVVFSLLVIIPVIIGSFLFFTPCTPQARDSRIRSAIAQSYTVISFLYSHEADYDDFNCGYKDMILICQEIDKNYQDSNREHKKPFEVIDNRSYTEDGREPIITRNTIMNSQKACIYSPLNEKPNFWYCADSEDHIGYTLIDPGANGYCVDGKSATCPPLITDI